ncbi:MAG: HAMP domain-containing protein [Anaerolineae bacterium]|nr:HAMP domain-containing protein [Anaerolineae bacterium]
MIKTRTNSPRRTRGLSAILATTFFALSVLTLLFSGGVLLFLNVQTQRQAIVSQQQVIAQAAAGKVSNFIQEKFIALTTTVSTAKLDTVSADRKQTLEGLMSGQPAFRQVAWLDAQDREVATVSRTSRIASGRLIEKLDTDAQAQVRQNQNYISPIYFDDVSSEPLIVMAIPMNDAVGAFQGTLVAEVNLKFMWDVVDQLKVGETGYAYVVDEQGNLIAFTDTARVLRGENVASISKVGEFVRDLSEPSGAASQAEIYTGLDGTTIVGSYAPLGTPSWAVIAELPWQEAYRDVIQATILSIVVVLGVAMAASVAGVVMARRLAVPLVNLTNTAGRIAAGEMALEADVQGPREVANLATAFNSMSTSLKAMIDKEIVSRTVLQTTVDLYMSFVEKVAQGDLAQRLDLFAYESEPGQAEPLYVLGSNLNKMVSSLAEITDRNAQLLAETQRARDEAEEANRIKSQFLASMSHELRTPLNAILNFTKLLRKGIQGPVNERQIDTLSEVVASSQHLLSLINDVLDVSKIQSGALTLFVEENVALQDIVYAGARTAESLLKDKPVTLVKDIGADLPLILCDQRRVQQVLLNLLGNAAKFTDHGTITLSVKRQDDQILFVIKDTGAGIPKDQQDYIFEPFIQTETGIKHAGGTGLGLPISRSLVEAHGGRIWLESAPGEGSTFMFTLPIESPDLRQQFQGSKDLLHG